MGMRMTKSESEIAISVLRELILLETDTGDLYWKNRPSILFSDGAVRTATHKANAWNSKNAGAQALNCLMPTGHLVGKINGQKFHAHRVAFALFTGYWPTQNIDHINGDPSDNRPVNLRDVSQKENTKNRPLRNDSTTGVQGISLQGGKYKVYISVDGKQKTIGRFQCIDDAIAARKRAEFACEYHENHGRRSL